MEPKLEPPCRRNPNLGPSGSRRWPGGSDNPPPPAAAEHVRGLPGSWAISPVLQENMYKINVIRSRIQALSSEIKKPQSHQSTGCPSIHGTWTPMLGALSATSSTPTVLRLRQVGATVEFTVGDKPVNNLHRTEALSRYQLLKSFAFHFSFCHPRWQEHPRVYL